MIAAVIFLLLFKEFIFFRENALQPEKSRVFLLKKELTAEVTVMAQACVGPVSQKTSQTTSCCRGDGEEEGAGKQTQPTLTGCLGSFHR